LGLQISLGFQQQLIVLVLPLPLGLHLSPLRPSIIIHGSYTNDQPYLYDVLGLFKSASGHGPFKCFMVLALSCVLITVLGLFRSASSHGPFKCFMVLALSCVLINLGFVSLLLLGFLL